MSVTQTIKFSKKIQIKTLGTHASRLHISIRVIMIQTLLFHMFQSSAAAVQYRLPSQNDTSPTRVHLHGIDFTYR